VRLDLTQQLSRWLEPTLAVPIRLADRSEIAMASAIRRSPVRSPHGFSS